MGRPRGWWILCAGALLGCNAILGLDPRTVAETEDGGSIIGDGAVGEESANDGTAIDATLAFDGSPDARSPDAPSRDGFGRPATEAGPQDATVDVDAEASASAMPDSGTYVPTCDAGTCGPHQTCSVVQGAPVCSCMSTLCTEAGSACQDAQTIATCAKDSDGCFYVASTSPCVMPQSCSGLAPNAACSSTCSSSCVQGQTTCVASQLATCTMGSNGCWAYGTGVACASARQTCSGSAGTAACTCNPDPVCSLPGGACANSSTAVQCAQDAQGCLYQASPSPCVNQTCLSGACQGVCAPTQTKCNGNTPQSCDSSGQWQSGTACAASQVCLGGSCVAPLPNCQSTGPGLTTCGSASESCCASLEVPGGTYYRTYTNTGDGGTGEADPATVSGFRLDKYLVTVGRFRQFVAALNGGWSPGASSGKHTHLSGGSGLANSGSAGTYEGGWQTSDNGNIAPTNTNLACSNYAEWTAAPSTQENLPMGCMNWYEAYAFCIWDGGFLPSEAEWEYAAAGGSNQLEYPWGSTSPGTSNLYAVYNCYYPSGSSNCTGVANVAPVGTPTQGTGLWGHLDLAGEMWEWNLDWNASYVDPCTNCAYLTSASNRAIRGGTFDGSASGLVPPFRGYSAPTYRFGDVGARCARTP